MLVFDYPVASKYYVDVIDVLTELTGVKWGYRKSKRKVLYVCNEVNEKITAEIKITRGKPFYPHKKADIILEFSQPELFPCRDDFKDIIALELKFALRDNPAITPEIRAALAKWKHKTHSGDCYMHMLEQQWINGIYEDILPVEIENSYTVHGFG